MTCESVSKNQADVRKGCILTTERKSMSTKTTIKRIALVSVSALGFGMLSVVPSNSITVGTYTGSLSSSTSSLTVVSTTSGLTKAGMFSIDLIDDKSFPQQGLFGTESVSLKAYGVTLHSLRKTYAYLLKQSNIHVTTAAKLLGHSTQWLL